MALKRWIGAADAVAQVTTITFSTYSASETYTLTINGKNVSFTATTGTNTDIWNGLQTAWADSSVPEHIEAIATVSSGVVLTSRTPGQPFTVTASATTGTATVTTGTAASGPNHFGVAANWEGGVAPVANDDLLFADSDVDVLYGLEPALNLGVVTADRSFTGAIGLARVSDSGYSEYRPRYLKLVDAVTIDIGRGVGNGSNRILIDADDNDVTVDVYSSGQGTSVMPIEIKTPSTSSVLSVYGGRVAFEGTTGGAASLNVIASNVSDIAPDVTVSSGLAVGVVTASGSNAQLEIAGSATSCTASDGANVTFTGASTCPTLSASSNSVVYWDSSGNIATKLTVYPGGTVSFDRRKVSRTVTACELQSGGSLFDQHKSITWTGGVALVGKIEDVNLDLGRNVTVSI